MDKIYKYPPNEPTQEERAKREHDKYWKYPRVSTMKSTIKEYKPYLIAKRRENAIRKDS